MELEQRMVRMARAGIAKEVEWCLADLHGAPTTETRAEAVIAAASCGHTAVLETLLRPEYGPLDVNDHRDGEGATALIRAAQWGHAECVQALIAAQADVDLWCEPCGSTALHMASWCGFRGACEVLIAAKADVDAENAEGTTAMIAATAEGHSEVVALLAQHHADTNVCDVVGLAAVHYAMQARIINIIWYSICQFHIDLND